VRYTTWPLILVKYARNVVSKERQDLDEDECLLRKKESTALISLTAMARREGNRSAGEASVPRT